MYNFICSLKSEKIQNDDGDTSTITISYEIPRFADS